MIWWALGEVVGETVGIEGDRLVQLVDNKDYIYIIQMSKVDKQDVLKAILNVKMYAKNLKRNASTNQEIEFDGGDYHEITSSPSLMAPNRQFFQDQMPSPVLNQGTSFRESHQPKKFKGQKDYSMSNFPTKKTYKVEQPLTKTKANLNSEVRQFSEDSRNYLFQSMKSDVMRNQPYQYAPLREELNYSKKPKLQKSQILEEIAEKSPTKKQNILNPQLVAHLLKQIELLNEQLNHYKTALLTIKHQYLSLEQKANEKVSTDHYVDILKQQIRQLQQHNETLKTTIYQQNRQIQQFDESIAKIAEEFRAKYSEDVKNMTKLKTMNQILTSLSNSRHLQIEHNYQKPEEEDKEEKMEVNNFCRSEEDLKKKWKLGEV